MDIFPRAAAAAIAAMLAFATGPASATTVTGKISFFSEDMASDVEVGGAGSNTYSDHQQRQQGTQSAGGVQIGTVYIDWLAGTIRGFQSALDNSGPLGGLTSVTRAEVHPLLKVASTTGSTSSDPVLLDLSLSLSATHAFPFSVEQQDIGSHEFNATLSRQVYQNAGTDAEVRWHYSWLRTFGNSSYFHVPSQNAVCAGCGTYVVDEDLFEYGFYDVEIHLLVPMVPDIEYMFNVVVYGTTFAKLVGASGDWLGTAQLGFTLPQGFTLVDADGNDLAAWNSPVPLPGTLLFACSGIAALIRPMRHRAARVQSPGRDKPARRPG